MRIAAVIAVASAFGVWTNECLAQTAPAGDTTPTRSDSIAKGDKIIFNADAPIFRLDSNAGGDSKTKVCAPRRTQIEIESAPSTTVTTETKSSNPAVAPVTKTTPGAATSIETTAAAAGDKTTTTVSSTTKATARIERVGPSFYNPFGKSKPAGTCVEQVPGQLTGVQTVVVGTTYEFTPSDLDKYSVQRYGLTYGVAVVPTKVNIVDRTFVSSSSVLPYVGYEAWGPGWAGAWVLAAGVGTAPASAQTSSSTSTAKATIATFSVATGIIGTVGGAFKVGALLGVDTVGHDSGFKYQGKPWIGVSLGAGTK